MKRKLIIYLSIILIVINNIACSMFSDDNPRVVSSEPFQGETGVSDDSAITITFNKNIDTQKCIAAFNLQPNPGGIFSYENKKLIYTPGKKFDLGTTYVFSIDQRCEDEDGRDLKEPYIATFAIGSDIVPPELIADNPMNGDLSPACGASGSTVIADFQMDVCSDKDGLRLNFYFTEEMNQSNTTSAFQIAPTVDGAITWSGTTMSFIPQEDLQRDTLYRIEIDNRASDLNGNHLSESFIRYFTTAGDRESPNILGIYSDLTSGSGGCNGDASDILTTNDLIEVCVDNASTGKNALFRIDFDKKMDPSFTKTALSITPSINGTLSMGNNNSQLFFTANETLLPDTEYHINVTTNARDAYGNSLLDQYIRFFRTSINSGYPIVSSIIVKTGGIYPACGGINSDILTGSVIDACEGNPDYNPIVVTFSEPMDKITTEDAFSISPSFDGYFLWANNNSMMTFNPSNKFTYGQRYIVEIATSAEDIQGQKLQSKVRGTFSTIAAAVTYPTISSMTLKTGGVYPVCGGTDSDLLTGTITDACVGDPSVNPIIVNFSESMKKAQTEDAFSISPSIEGYFSWDVTNTVMTYTPNGKYQYGKRYTVSISTNAESRFGQKMESTVKSYFVAVVEDGTPPTSNSITVNFEQAGDVDGASIPANDIIALNNSNTSTNNTISLNVPIIIDFPEPVDQNNTLSALSISPSVGATYYWISSTQLQISSVAGLSSKTTYVLKFSKALTDLAGNPLDSEFALSFSTEDISPYIVAIGVESQNVDWENAGEFQLGESVSTLPRDSSSFPINSTCWWDSSKEIKSPMNYLMRSGDDQGCINVSSDNIVLVFSKAMDQITTLNAISLKRVTGVSSTIIIPDWSWSPSKKVVTLKISESRSIGCGSTLNDLGSETNLAHELSIYRIEIDTTAKDSTGSNLGKQFIFSFKDN